MTGTERSLWFFPSRTVPRCPRPQIMRLDSSLKVRSPSHLWQFFTYALRSGSNSQFWQVVINFLHSFLIFLYNIICYCFNVKINFKIPEYQCSLAVASCSMNTVLPMFRSSFPFLFLTPGCLSNFSMHRKRRCQSTAQAQFPTCFWELFLVLV